jgi:hypothetical protein
VRGIHAASMAGGTEAVQMGRFPRIEPLWLLSCSGVKATPAWLINLTTLTALTPHMSLTGAGQYPFPRTGEGWDGGREAPRSPPSEPSPLKGEGEFRMTDGATYLPLSARMLGKIVFPSSRGRHRRGKQRRYRSASHRHSAAVRCRIPKSLPSAVVIKTLSSWRFCI